MAVHPRRVSKTRKKKRNSHSALNLTVVSVCSNCAKYSKAHTVCSCGYYRGRKIIKDK